MVTPFLTLQQLCVLFSKPSSVLLEDAEASRSSAESHQNDGDEQHQEEHPQTLSGSPTNLFTGVKSFRDVA